MLADLIPALSIFFLRVLDVSLYTIRFMMVLQGRKLLAWGFAFCQAFIFVVAIRAVLSDVGNWLKIVGYAAGFATGLIVGMLLEERMGLGYRRIQIISPRHGQEIAQHLRQQGFGVTEIPAIGRDGTVEMITSDVQRRQASEVEKLVQRLDPQAFITTESIRPLWRGFWRTY